MNEKCNVRCPKCGSKTLYAYEHIIAESQHKIVDGIWRHEHDNNEYGDGIDITFRCDRCQHFWKGRKGVTIESYLIDD